MIPGIRADRTLGVPGPLPAGRTGGRQGPRVGQAALSPPPRAGTCLNSAATSGTNTGCKHGTAARHGTAAVISTGPRATGPCSGPAPARTSRAHSQGACVSTGRVRWPRSVARWRCGPRHGASWAPRTAAAEAPGTLWGGAGLGTLAPVALPEAPATRLPRMVETRAGRAVLIVCFQERRQARFLFEMLAVIVR